MIQGAAPLIDPDAIKKQGTELFMPAVPGPTPAVKKGTMPSSALPGAARKKATEERRPATSRPRRKGATTAHLSAVRPAPRKGSTAARLAAVGQAPASSKRRRSKRHSKGPTREHSLQQAADQKVLVIGGLLVIAAVFVGGWLIFAPVEPDATEAVPSAHGNATTGPGTPAASQTSPASVARVQPSPPPTQPQAPADGTLVLHLPFDEAHDDFTQEPFARGRKAMLMGGATCQTGSGKRGGALVLDGKQGLAWAENCDDINMTVHGQRTISLWFRAAGKTDRRQVLYEEGGKDRGLSIYLEKGRVYVGGWNVAEEEESGWSGTFLSRALRPQVWQHVALVLNGGKQLSKAALRAYLNGTPFGTGGPGSQLWAHSGDIGVGAMKGQSRFHDGPQEGSDFFFAGAIDELYIYNRALGPAGIQALARGETPPPEAAGPTAAGAVSAHVTADQLAGMVGRWCFDAGEGTNVWDRTGLGNHGMLKHGPEWQSVGGPQGGYLSFDGKDDVVIVPHDKQLNLRNAMSISAWVQARSWEGHPRILQKGGQDNQYRLLAEDGRLRFDLHTIGAVECDLPKQGEWHHIAATYDGVKLRLYVDGKRQAATTADGTIAASSDCLCFGSKAGEAPAGDHFAGLLDEIRLYSVALNQGQIEALARKR